MKKTKNLDTKTLHALIKKMREYVTENKQTKINEVLSNRTRQLTVVLENLYQAHNASAVIRSCDCFGVQDLYVIENSYTFSVNKGVVMGSSKWVDIHRYNETDDNTEACLINLKKQGYKIAATTLRPGSIPIHEIDLTQKTALLFGTEEIGLTETAHELADEMVYIPMCGFTQSLNISVSAAICLHQLMNTLKSSEINWQLSEHERLAIELEWLAKSASNGDKLLNAWV